MQNEVDNIFLISADSDLVTTIEFVQNSFVDKHIRVCFPPCRKSADIIDTIGNVIYLKNNISKFHKAIMSDRVTNGINIATIPDEWIVYPFSNIPEVT